MFYQIEEDKLSIKTGYTSKYFENSCEDCQYCINVDNNINHFKCEKNHLQTSWMVILENGNEKTLSFPQRYRAPSIFKDGNHDFEKEHEIMKNGCSDFMKFK